jgi:hypothetical protein
MVNRKSISITLLALLLIVVPLVSRPRVVVYTEAAVTDAFDWVTEKLSRLVEPPAHCPWRQECI